ncbi:MAG: cellobiose phosphorylase [Lachnospiraceae bacterium]|nr:cellobiose phosphorylase [Lachnospiraceae bacterium]
MKGYHFLDEQGTFELDMSENYSYQYFPVAGEKGIKSALTPNFGGDSKRNQNEFLLEPVSVENLHNNRSTRNFWCHIEGRGNWSVTGASAQAEQTRFTDAQDKSKMTAGLMWQSVSRISSEYQMEAQVTSFVPIDHDVEIMYVELTNCGKEQIEFVPTAAIPIYGRSADNIRDHRHVTSLLHRIRIREEGVLVMPTLSFDERGHQTNKVCYYVCGVTDDGSTPEAFYPTTEEFIGEGGSYTAPRAVIENYPGVPAKGCIDGKEAMGGLKFATTVLLPGEHTSFTILLGATENPEEITEIVNAYRTAEQTESAFTKTKDYWQEKVNIAYHTGSKEFDNFMRWVSFQPILRRIYGCSFLPHHDYGKGGRGWRDLWQDCLALLLMSPEGVRQMLLDNYGGVRMDGTNATIIGAKQGEFIADRNNITRVWMDHGVWPFMTTKLYMDQTGDVEILEKKVPYFKDRQAERGTSIDEQWNDEYGNCQKDAKGNVYYGTVLEHLLLQNLCAFYEVGGHNHCRLRGADWNDALDMAQEQGESVAFTNAYAGNLRQLAEYILFYAEKTGKTQVSIAEEMQCLLGIGKEKYDSRDEKNQILVQYTKSCRHTVSGKTVSIEINGLVRDLQEKADWMMNHIRQSEWVTDQAQNGWFNGYYDNHGRQVEGVNKEGVRMMLTSQVFAIMGGTATNEQIRSITKSADKYLYDKHIGGYRLNTDFHELKTDLGRMFGFAYGEKENGAVFSHMAVMYANALYQRGFAKEGYKALQTLADTAMEFETSKIYPGIPEYFNAKGRGMYHYLTGAASWYMLTFLTEVFGVRGREGDLEIAPALMGEQFDETGKARVELPFADRRFHIVIENPQKLQYGEYRIRSAVMEDYTLPLMEEVNEEGQTAVRAVLERAVIERLSGEVHTIEILLDAQEGGLS